MVMMVDGGVGQIGREAHMHEDASHRDQHDDAFDRHAIMGEAKSNTRSELTPWRSSRVARKIEGDSQQSGGGGGGGRGAEEKAQSTGKSRGHGNIGSIEKVTMGRGGDDVSRNHEDALDGMSKLSIASSSAARQKESWKEKTTDASDLSRPNHTLQSSIWAPKIEASTSPSRNAKSAARTSSPSPSKVVRSSVESSGLRPRDTSKPLGGKLDPMSLLASPSRGLDGSHLEGLMDGDITDLHVQLQYRAHISEQIRKHASSFSITSGPSSGTCLGDADEKRASLSNLILLARKLREGLLAGSSGKSKALNDSTTANLLIEISQLSIALSLLSEPPNLAQLHATLPRLISTLGHLHQSPPSKSREEKGRIQIDADIVALLELPEPEACKIAALLSDVTEDGLAHILSLQRLLALYSGTTKTNGDSFDFGHAEYLSLHAEAEQQSASISDESPLITGQHPHLRFVHELHRALVQGDVASIRNLFLHKSAQVPTATFWHTQLLLSPSSSTHQDQHERARSTATNNARQHLVGTTSNSTASQTTAILNRFRAMVWDSLAKAYKPMGLPIAPFLVPVDRLSSDVKARLSSSQAQQAQDATWLERLLLLDDDFILAVHRIRGRPESQTNGGDALLARSMRLDVFLSNPACKLGGFDWPSRVDVRADGQSAILRLK
ncbi:hypothetical protein CF319_g4081 [Tilletia indica]|nr:hypothetical protein CF319_g4081 [Tilletia indica]